MKKLFAGFIIGAICLGIGFITTHTTKTVATTVNQQGEIVHTFGDQGTMWVFLIVGALIVGVISKITG